MTIDGDGDADTTDGEFSADDPAAPDDTAAASRRMLLTVLGAVAVLLIGMGLGLLIAAMMHSDDPGSEVAPTADSAAVGFAQDMIRHHEQGIEMAAIELENGTDPQVRSMAFDILTAQSNEIGQMQSWLTRWGQPLINPGSPMAWMGHEMSGSTAASGAPHEHDMSSDHGTSDEREHGPEDEYSAAHDDAGMAEENVMPPVPTAEPPMPGMATPADMDRLRSTQGTDTDIYFLQLMLRHHEGGIDMMDYATDPDHVSEDYVRDLAAGMQRNQTKEIAVLTAMIGEHGAQPLPMN
ncbi:MAG: DUF305 domain-containing protein [Actinomycetota bacterium]|nr:DUF305 domain-containing protein [Actinomycetota bacterium]